MASKLVLAVLFISLTGTLICWRLAVGNERAHIQRMTHLAASAVAADLRSDMDARLLGQVRLAKMWEFDEPNYDQWMAFAGLYVEHHPGCLAIEWLDPKYQERWIVRSPGETSPLPGNGTRESLLQSALRSKEPALSNLLKSPGGRKQWLNVVPIYQKGQFRGFVLASFDAQRSLDTMFEDIKGLNFSVAIEENGMEAFRLDGSTTRNEQEWPQTIDVPLQGRTWRLKVWSKPEAMGEMRSNLPMVTLLAGLSACLLLVVIAQMVEKLRAEIGERKRFEASLRASQARFAGILAISAEAIISADADMRITLYNQSAENIFGFSAREALGQPLDILIPGHFHTAHARHVAEFSESAKQSLHMSKRRRVFGLRKDGTEFPMTASVSRLDLGEEKIFTIICSDITQEVRAAEELRKAHDELELRVRERTADLEQSNLLLQNEIIERKEAEQQVEDLSRRMMRVQEEERRNLARELHDGATQNMVALTLNMAPILDSIDVAPATRSVIEECMRLIDESTSELRTISYLLHPPLLEELGLSRTLRGYVEGFSRRSGVAVSLTTQGELDRLGFDVELAVFRIVQESLSNVHRHSHSSTANILLIRQGSSLNLEIADQGRGMPPGKDKAGVGIGSIRERVRLLKGTVNISSDASGTIISISLPVPEDQAASSGAVA
ncbi:MAG: PAS domain-containing sensor histidine kinase [Acidobacteriia bacterium]|nr:PAS domain-containing sensor histidine kinase [Terriglobia bacterium]